MTSPNRNPAFQGYDRYDQSGGYPNIKRNEVDLDILNTKVAQSYVMKESQELTPQTTTSIIDNSDFSTRQAQYDPTYNRFSSNFEAPRVNITETFTTRKNDSNEAINQIDQLRSKIENLKNTLARKDEEARNLKAQIEAVLKEPKESFLEKVESKFTSAEVNEAKKDLKEQEKKIIDLRETKTKLENESITLKDSWGPTQQEAKKLEGSLNSLSALLEAAKKNASGIEVKAKVQKIESKPRNWLRLLGQMALYLFICAMIILMYVDLPVHHPNSDSFNVAPERVSSGPKLLSKTKNGTRGKIDL